MLERWRRALVSVTILAFIANAQCFGMCAAGCKTMGIPSDSCHHQQSNDKHTPQCSHQHSEFAGAEAGLPEIHLTTIAMLPNPAARPSIVSITSRWLAALDTASPPPGSPPTI